MYWRALAQKHRNEFPKRVFEEQDSTIAKLRRRVANFDFVQNVAKGVLYIAQSPTYGCEGRFHFGA